MVPRIAIPTMLSREALRRPVGAVVSVGGVSMGTRWSARAVGGDAAALQAGLQGALDGVVAEMSHWEPESDLSRFNRGDIGAWFSLPPALLAVLLTGLDIAERSDGAFDPAIGNLVNRWGFGPTADAGAANGWRAIEVRGGMARRTADVRLDLSGIAKGYAVDAMAEFLLGQGLANFLVEAGGELRGEGIKPDGQPWWVDLEAVPGLAMPVTRVALCGLAVATSGDYRRFHDRGSVRGSHSIDPRSGAPIANNVASVTVLHPQAMLADAWATALTVLGPAAAMAMADAERLAAVLIERLEVGAREYQSPAFGAMLGET